MINNQKKLRDEKFKNETELEWLRRNRPKLNLTEVATSIGVNRGNLTEMISGNRVFPEKHLNKLKSYIKSFEIKEKEHKFIVNYPPRAKHTDSIACNELGIAAARELAAVDGEFRDSYGIVVSHNSVIKIESNYNFQHLNNKYYVVQWDSNKGMYRFHKFKFREIDKWGDDFHGISKFKKIGCFSCIDNNGQNIGNMYVCPDCNRIVD